MSGSACLLSSAVLDTRISSINKQDDWQLYTDTLPAIIIPVIDVSVY